MRRFSRLAWLAVVVWIGWLGLMGLLGGMLVGHVRHPHFLPVTAVLAVFVGAGLVLVTLGTWRVLRGPGRLGALTCLLLGTPPLLFFAGHFLYGLKAGYGRTVDIDLPIKALVPLGESVMDLEARFRYTRRTVGEKVVMISGEVPRAREQVAAMDRHVRALERRLGLTTRGRIHWVRGPLLGMDGKAIYGICLGSRPGANPTDDEGLTGLDRHEVAHCVIGNHMDVDTDPPAVLSEGWAEANSGLDPTALMSRLVSARENGRSFSLAELTGPDWYNRHEWPVYNRGGPLVNFLLKTYGPERFVRLYLTCRQATFADDVRRVLGVTVDDLDAAFWADVERCVGRGDTREALLRRLKTGPGVEPSAWQAFLDEYFREAARLLEPSRHVRMTAERSFSTTDAKGKAETFTTAFSIADSGAFRSVRARHPQVEVVELAHPRRSFRASRDKPGEPWVVDEFAGTPPEAAYRRMLGSVRVTEQVTEAPASLLQLADELRNRVDTSRIAVTKIERFTEGDRRYVRVRLEDRTAGVGWRSVTAVLSADDHFAVRSNEVERTDGTVVRGTFEYDDHDGVPVLRSSRSAGPSSDGGRFEGRLTVLERRFGPTPESEFTPERLLDGPTVRKPPDPDPYRTDRPTFADWYRVPFAAGAAMMALGVGVGLLGPFRADRSAGGAV
jgi:hypothetical protein